MRARSILRTFANSFSIGLFQPSIRRKVSKAFLITGGTPADRQAKLRELISGDQFLMCCDYKGENELAVIFSATHSDFDGMTFQEAKKLANNIKLSPTFSTSTFGREPRFGIIDVTEIKIAASDIGNLKI